MAERVSLLAIIIPAYKGGFLRAALSSIALQTNQEFQLYVFDDESPENLREIFEGCSLAGRPNVKFRRFEENMGGRSLVGQWNRCVEATSGEPWVWLFSDDDVAHPSCVEAFLQRLSSVGNEDATVFRFNTAIINDEGTCVAVNPPHPGNEDDLHFIYHRMLWQRQSFAPEYIFSRAAYSRCGGFIDFPFALGSDDASWISFSEGNGIQTLEGPLVYWRRSGQNTSFVSGTGAIPKLLGLLAFTLWLRERCLGRPFPNAETLSAIDLPELIRKWYLTFLNNVQKWLSASEIDTVARTLHEQAGYRAGDIRLRLLRSNLRFVWHGLRRKVKSWID